MKALSLLAALLLALSPVAQANPLVSVSFQSENVFSPAFKALPGDADKPLFLPVSGKPRVEDGKLVLANGRVAVGAIADAGGAIIESNADRRPAGALDLSRPYRIVLTVTEATTVTPGKDNFFIYVNNSTSRQADSPLGKSSQLARLSVSGLTVGENVFTGKVGDASSFIQLRAESGASVKISAIRIEYQ